MKVSVIRQTSGFRVQFLFSPTEAHFFKHGKFVIRGSLETGLIFTPSEKKFGYVRVNRDGSGCFVIGGHAVAKKMVSHCTDSAEVPVTTDLSGDAKLAPVDLSRLGVRAPKVRNRKKSLSSAPVREQQANAGVESLRQLISEVNRLAENLGATLRIVGGKLVAFGTITTTYRLGE